LKLLYNLKSIPKIIINIFVCFREALELRVKQGSQDDQDLM